MAFTTSRRLLGAAALAGALALTAAACGSSSKTTTPAKTSPTANSSAASDQVNVISHLTGVGTTVTLDPSTATALTGLGVKVAPVGSATASMSGGNTSVTFPITSGYAEIHSNKNYKPGDIVGSIEHAGSGLSFTAGGKTLTVSNFVVDPGNSMLYATVGTMQEVPILFLDGTNVKVSMANGDVVLDGTVAKLTQTAATALDQEFGTTKVTAGLPLGTVHLVASGALTSYNEATDHTTLISRLSGTSTSVALDPSTAQALTALGVKVAPVGAATFANGSITFPITGGMAVIHSNKSAQPGYIDGVLLHQGSGMELSAGGKTLTLSDFIVDPGNSTLTATVGGKPGVPIADLDGSPLQVSMVDGSVHLDGTIVKLTPTAATAIDQTFGTTKVTAGLELGIAHLIVSGAVASN